MTNDKRTRKHVIATATVIARALPEAIHLVCFATLAMTFLASCSDDETAAQQPTANAVSFTAGIGNTATPQTRTTNGGDHWAAGDLIGIFMLTENGELTNPADLLADNVEYRATPGDPASTATFAPAVGVEAINWPDAGSYDFIAYYSQRPSIAINNYKIEIGMTTQTNETQLNYTDVLYARAPSQSQSGGAVAFEFDHVMSKITLNVKAGSGGIAATDITAMERTDVVFGNMPFHTSLNLQDGTLETSSNTLNFSPFKPATPADGFDATFSAILVPQPQNGGTDGTPDYNGRTVTFTVGGTAYTWNIPDGQVFAPGTHYTFTVTVNHRTAITVGNATILPWNTTVSGTGEAEQYTIQPQANSYMMAPNSDPILIPISQANRVTTADGLGADATGLGGVTATNYTVELVWGDTPVGDGGVIKAMRPFGEYIYVEPGAAGNAVIAIRDNESGAIKWSWHIWVTEAVSYATDPATGLTWMDRNLGAGGAGSYQSGGRNGLFYQWGRKDAFPGSNGNNGSQQYYTQAGGSTAGNDNLTGSYTDLPGMVQNPLNFATNYETYYGSLNEAGANNKSWSDGGAKTLYDPCPPGWKMPPIEVNGADSWTWSAWGAWENNGRVFKSGSVNHFYPAAGRRIGNEMYSSGTGGYYWSTSIYETNYAAAWTLYSGGVSGESTYRNSGFSIRCVKE